MSTDLKPCPFCGSSATLEDNRLVWFVRCDGCGAVVMGDRAPEPEVEMPGEYWDPFRQSAIDHWNRRAAVAGDQADYRALCAELLPALIEYDDANPYHDHHELIRRAETALDQPAAAGPTAADFHAWWRERYNLSWAPSAGWEQTAMEWAAFCLDRWGRPTAVPVSERLPGEADCCGNPRNGQGQWCWGRVRVLGPAETPVVWRLMRIDCLIDESVEWLPWWALPLPQSRPPEQQP